MARAAKTNKHCSSACLSCRKSYSTLALINNLIAQEEKVQRSRARLRHVRGERNRGAQSESWVQKSQSDPPQCVWETGRDRRTAGGREGVLHDKIAQLEAQNAYLVALVKVLSPGFNELPNTADFAATPPSTVPAQSAADAHCTLRPGGESFPLFDAFPSPVGDVADSSTTGAPYSLSTEIPPSAGSRLCVSDARAALQYGGQFYAPSDSLSPPVDNFSDITTASTSAAPYSLSSEMSDTSKAPLFPTLVAHGDEALPWHATPPLFTGNGTPEGPRFA
ncbi:hypothetical protein AURDEDRAFT_129085 [Auricularia subglabra TFB-10046 SS5]|nr:hypothetical protein AURDEDRAFT_129085 [Auricularia subglabra TFB-10046 SS5]